MTFPDLVTEDKFEFPIPSPANQATPYNPSMSEMPDLSTHFDPSGNKNPTQAPAQTNLMHPEFSGLGFDLSSNSDTDLPETMVPADLDLDRSRSNSPTTSSKAGGGGGVSKKARSGRRKPPVVILSPNLQLAAEANLLDSLSTEGSGSGGGILPPKVFADEVTYLKYVKRRQNNNVAATKSRLKKKQEEQANMERSKILESENENLRQELQKLQVETKYLKEVLQTILSSQGQKS